MLPPRENVAFSGDQDPKLAGTGRAGLESLLTRLPDGLDTWLDPARPGGVSLSGGEWQRVARARAAVRNADVVVLDEPTAALDPQAESAAVVGLLDAAPGRTAVVVSHPLGIARCVTGWSFYTWGKRARMRAWWTGAGAMRPCGRRRQGDTGEGP